MPDTRTAPSKALIATFGASRYSAWRGPLGSAGYVRL